ncbi:MAG: HNH endonuclease, partial [Bacteroidota bacterium]|nr:HNH endonuclease [Bacteroidota bacterium]
MKLTRGNLALKNHLHNGKRVFLFEANGRGAAKFISELVFLEVESFTTLDTSGNERMGIKFFFLRKGFYLPIDLNLLNDKTAVAEPLFEFQFNPPNETERRGLITSRVGQGAYRKRIIHRWEYKCAVTDFDKLNLLIASHILPWAQS